MTTSRHAVPSTSERGSWAETCSAPVEDLGLTTLGRDGGAAITPFHAPVFVLTHHARDSITMDGGTIFHFVTDGIHAALKQASEAANGKDVLLGGGVSTIQQYLRAGLVDEMHLTIAPILLGSGEHLFAGIHMPELGYRCTEHVPTRNVTHVVLTKKPS